MNLFMSILLLFSLLTLQFGCDDNMPPEPEVQKQEKELGVDDIREVGEPKVEKVEPHHEMFGNGEAEIDD